MKRKLGSYILAAFIMVLLGIISIGGLSILMVKDIIHNVHYIKEESKHVDQPESLHDKSYDLLLSIHHFIVKPDKEYADRALKVFDEIEKSLGSHADAHGAEHGDDHHGISHENLTPDELKNNLESIKEMIVLIKEYSETGSFNSDKILDLESYRNNIEEFIKTTNRYHFTGIGQKVDDSYKKMSVILYLYFAFFLIGSLVAYIGYKLLKNKTVLPIKQLAAATEKVAAGDLTISVSTNSMTEIGSLYNSFNTMTKKLHSNEMRLESFNRRLENKVVERTEELQKANDELHKTQATLVRTEKGAAIGQIAAGVTHEIKNPLNSLSINTQMLMRDLSAKFGTDSSEYESASHIRFEVNRINNILEEFVKYAKFPEPQFFDNDMNIVAQEVIGLIAESSKAAGVSINSSLQPGIPSFKFDARQIKEVLINLFQNAVSSMKDGGALGISTSMVDNGIAIKVKDTGAGISDKNIENIFTPFFSTKEGGMGLGLPICLRIVESHGGTMKCTSNVGEGTVFEIVIPVDPA